MMVVLFRASSGSANNLRRALSPEMLGVKIQHL